MRSRERMDAAMRPAEGRLPDRVPAMCQLAVGHYFLNSGLPPADIWHDSETFATALVTLQRRYRFDGILVNLPGRDPAWRDSIAEIDKHEGTTVIRWSDGFTTTVPPDDNPRVTEPACVAEMQRGGSSARTGRESGSRRIRRRQPPSLASIDPGQLFYVEPHGARGVTALRAFPPHQFSTLRRVRELAPDVSVHGEVFSPFSQLVELLGPAEAMLGLVDAPEKVQACLGQLVAGAVQLGIGLVKAGADAVLISSAYAGAGFISPRHYEEFVLPFERAIIDSIKAAAPAAIVYTHTCGAIDDRLELMESTGTDGIDTLDPPPLGTVDLADARRRLSARLFIKGNIDPVNTILRGTAEECRRDARERIAVAGPAGYIVSSACSVPPHATPANIMAIVEAAEESACVA